MKFDYILNPKISKSRELYNVAVNSGMVAFDIETNSLDPFSGDILLIQFGVPGLSLLFSESVPSFLFKLLQDPKVLVLGHNLKFDYKWMKHKLNLDMVNCYDTMLSESSINLGKRVSVGLGRVAKRRLNIDMQKEVRTGFVGLAKGTNFSEAQLLYGARDVQVLYEIREQQLKEINNLGLNKIIRLENETLLVTGDMELEGFRLDTDKLNGLIDKYEIELLSVCETIYKEHPRKKPISFGFFADTHTKIQTYIESLNLGSPVQVLEDLHAAGYKVESTDHRTLSLLAPHCKFAGDILKFRELKKLIDFPKDWLSKVNPVTNKLHPEYRQLNLWGSDQSGGTVSGRYSSKYPNFQQVPRSKELRSCFLAPEGYLTATIDYSAQEIRIMTNIALDPDMVDFHLGKFGTNDYHGFVAAGIFGKELHEVCKSVDENGNEIDPPFKDLRYRAKTVNYSSLYGIGPAGLSRQFPIEIPDKNYSPAGWLHYLTLEQERLYNESYEILNSYRESFPVLTAYLRRLGKEAVQKRRIDDKSWGRIRWFPHEMEDYRVEKAAANFVPQSNNGTQMKYSLCNIRRKLPQVRIAASVHDEGVYQLPIGEAEYLTREIGNIMVSCSKEVVDGPAEYSVGVSLEPHWTK